MIKSDFKFDEIEHEVFNSKTVLPKEYEFETISETLPIIIYALITQFSKN